MKKTYSIIQACEDVAASLRPQDVNDIPHIRTAINDTMDMMSKDGFAVRFDFNQDSAVRRVRRIARNRQQGQ